MSHHADFREKERQSQDRGNKDCQRKQEKEWDRKRFERKENDEAERRRDGVAGDGERVKLAVAYNISCEHSSTGYCRCSMPVSSKQALHVGMEKTYFTALICWLLKF